MSFKTYQKQICNTLLILNLIKTGLLWIINKDETVSYFNIEILS